MIDSYTLQISRRPGFHALIWRDQHLCTAPCGSSVTSERFELELTSKMLPDSPFRSPQDLDATRARGA